jgi:hypothetical protein
MPLSARWWDKKVNEEPGGTVKINSASSTCIGVSIYRLITRKTPMATTIDVNIASSR